MKLLCFFSNCLLGLVLLASPVAWACAICAPSAEQNSLVFRLFAAQSALLAEPTPTPDSYQPVHGVKGALPAGVLTPSEKLPNAQSPTPQDVVLLLQNSGSNTWLDAGVVPLERLHWLRRLATLRPTPFVTPTDPGWPERVQLFVQDLEHPIPLLAQTAYDEIAVAPYTVMRTLQPALDAEKLSQWLTAPELAARRSLYNLLWGFAGNAQTAEALEKHIQASKGLNKADLSSMLAALLELRADAAVQWIEAEYFQSVQRSDVELQSAILALAVHANDQKKISRERVVQSFAVLVQNNPSRAGFVASDLGNWGRWEFVNSYMALLKSGQQQSFASRYAMVLYLMRSPSDEARNALEQLRAAGAL
jgi:hypothetical protein